MHRLALALLVHNDPLERLDLCLGHIQTEDGNHIQLEECSQRVVYVLQLNHRSLLKVENRIPLMVHCIIL